MEQKNQGDNVTNPYFFFQAKLYPALPYLTYQANQVRKKYPIPPAMSNSLRIGESDRSYLILGESTVAGVGAEHPQETLAYHIHTLLDGKVSIINHGKNGLRAKEIWPCFRKELSAISETIAGIFLFLGANDCFKLSTPSDFEKSLKKLIGQLDQQFSPDWIYLADIPPVHLFPAFPKILKSFLHTQRSYLREKMQSIASQNPQVFHEGIQVDLDQDFFSTDLIHPSGKGYYEIAKFSVNSLKQAKIIGF
ncbi:GDSL-type esterase/lipase family protein [Algoriphagus namhaensis]